MYTTSSQHNSLISRRSLTDCLRLQHWAYNGAAVSWGDTGNNGKWAAAERVAGHYRTTLNAIPMMEDFLLNPDDHYLLAPTIGAASLHMATIDSRGAASMGFHLSPKRLELDPYSGDFGVGFYGHVQLAASIYIDHPLHGPLCYLCDANTSKSDGGPTTIVPRDSIRRRVFIEPYGVLIEVMAGAVDHVVIDLSARTFTLQLKDDSLASKFRVKISTPSLNRPGRLEGVALTKPASLPKVRGAYEMPVVSPMVALVFAIGKTDTRNEPSSSTVWSVPTPVPGFADRACKMDVPAELPDQAHPQMQLAGAPDLKGFEGGFSAASSLACSQKCADQKSADGWHRLACQGWTFVEAVHSPKGGQAWCWLLAARGNAVGKCGYTTATCDNRPAPATDWPCCVNGFTCPDLFPNKTADV